MAAVWGYAEKLRILCTRELQASIRESFHAELKAAIASEPWLEQAYDVGIDYIRGKNGTEFIFRGLRHNVGSIKSTAQVDLCIVEEAEDVPERSWISLIPTIREPKSEIWVIWNPCDDESPVDKRYRKSNRDDALIVEMNYTDNPWFPDEMEQERLHDLEVMDPNTYAHIWEGAYLVNSESQILAGKWKVSEFTPGADWNGPYHGIDFGFSQDPTTANKCWIHDDCLYIEYESHKVGLELDHTADYIKNDIPGIEGYEVLADSARPESISYLKRNGLPRIKAVKKWSGSVEDGISHLRSYKKIIIHPRCKHTAKEARLYSYKVDSKSGQVLTVIVDAHNHHWDDIRYALGPMIKRNTNKAGVW